VKTSVLENPVSNIPQTPSIEK
jgi:hypothetical protein